MSDPLNDAVPNVELHLPAAVRPAAGGRASVELAARDVAELLQALERAHTAAWRMVCDEQCKPRPHLNVFVNLDSIRMLRGLATPLNEGDAVSIVPAVSGG
jgi:molybdopterin synthase sulfur carrier subunit